MSKIEPNEIELTILMPCLNESETLGNCLRKAKQGAMASGVTSYEIVVADNGSSDGSQAIAVKHGARVVEIKKQGYGSALLGGIEAARGKYVLMGDSDESYDFSQIDLFLQRLRRGSKFVMGTRIKGRVFPGAMPLLHRYLGTPVLTIIGNVFFGSRLSDFNCGMRGFNKEAIEKLGLTSAGMEFASEMVIRASLAGMEIDEIPIDYFPDGRTRAPHLRTWQDGWRHLRFMLIFSPRWLFLYPGIMLSATGLIGTFFLLPGPMFVAGIGFDVHTLLFFATVLIVGAQLIFLAAFAQIYASKEGFLPKLQRFEEGFKSFSLGPGLILGTLFSVIGISLYVIGFINWGRFGFGSLDYQSTLRIIIPGTTLVVMGLQFFFSSFLISVLGIQEVAGEI